MVRAGFTYEGFKFPLRISSILLMNSFSERWGALEERRVLCEVELASVCKFVNSVFVDISILCGSDVLSTLERVQVSTRMTSQTQLASPTHSSDSSIDDYFRT